MYVYLFGVLIISVLLVFKSNYLIRKMQGKENQTPIYTFATIYGWLIGTVACAISILLLYVYEFPGYYIQLIDLLLTLIIITIIDVKWRIIPNGIIITLLISQIVACFCLAHAYIDVWNMIISVAFLLVLMLISKISKEQIGMGDVKLLAVINLIYGLSFTAYSLIFSLLAMLMFAIPLLIMKKANLKSQIPFAPFYLCGVTVYMFINLI